MDKIGIYGGTFNPIHNGHINMVKQMARILELDLVLIIPAQLPPHKSWIPIVKSEYRYEMCKLAFEGEQRFQVSDVELKRKGNSYTVDTLREISNVYRNSRLYLMMGSDAFLSIIKWIGFEEIIKLATLCTAPRDENDLVSMLEVEETLKKRGAITKLCNIEILEISSTGIRNRISKGLKFEEMVPQKVAYYIKEKFLYM